MKRNARNIADGSMLFVEIDDGKAAAVFLDPQYRTGLDKLKFGNEGARQGRRASLPQMRDEMIRFFVEESVRVLRPSGHLFFWLDKFSIVTGHWRGWLPAEGIESVDMISWRKGRIGMGRRARNRTEFCVVLQKLPIRAKGRWTDHSLDDCWIEDVDPTVHPHAKPLQLTQRLIRATTKIGDLVVDPCAGGFGVLDACLATRREFFGCDVTEVSR